MLDKNGELLEEDDIVEFRSFSFTGRFGLCKMVGVITECNYNANIVRVISYKPIHNKETNEIEIMHTGSHLMKPSILKKIS